MKDSSNTEVRKFDNDSLRELYKEIKDMYNHEKPANVKQSESIKLLFELENYDFYSWSDKHSTVMRAIESEILHRVLKNKW